MEADMSKVNKYKQEADQAIILQYLKDKGYTVQEDKCSAGWIRWRRHSQLEGVVRLTAYSGWEICADPMGEWDRCANAAFNALIPEEICERSLDSAFSRLESNDR